MTKLSQKFGLRVLQGCVAVAAVLFAVGCSSAPAPERDTRAADAAMILKTDAAWAKAAQSKKVDDWMAFYTDDAVILPPNEPTASTKESVRKLIGEMFAMPNVVITWGPTNVEVAKSGDIGYVYGTYQMTWDDAAGKPAADHGKTLEIWKKQADGNWKCVVDSWSSDLPAAPVAPASK